MDQPQDESEGGLPPSTVPADATIAFRGIPADAEWFPAFQRTLQEITIGCGRIFDLHLLEGITVGSDYDDALASVRLGYESRTAKGYTKSEGLVGVGKTLRVLRAEGLKGHIVLNASCLGDLIDESSVGFLATANIVAHELAHVAVLGWFEDTLPGLLLSSHEGDWATAMLRDIALTVWEEYAACRLSAPISSEEVTTRYAECLSIATLSALPAAREKIKDYRLHGDVSRLLVEISAPLGNALKMAAYLLGHLEGLEDGRPVDSLCPGCTEAGFSGIVANLRQALREAWDNRDAWGGIEGANGIVGAILAALRTAGAIVTLRQEAPGTYVDVPFTPETMPAAEYSR